MPTQQVDPFPGNERAIKKLRQHLRTGEAIAFVGAGASAELYPVWNQLIAKLAEAAADRGLATEETRDFWIKIGARRPQQIAHSIKRVLTEGVYHDVLQKIFSPKKTDPRQFTPIHDVLLRIPFRGYVYLNYDECLLAARNALYPELALEAHCTWRDATCLREWLSGGIFSSQRRPILFAHGIHQRPKTIVLGSDEYRKAYLSVPYREVFKSLWNQRLVFIGFGFSDGWLDYIADDVITHANARAGAPRHIALAGQPEDYGYAPEMRHIFHEQYNTEPIFYYYRKIERDGGIYEDHAELMALLEPLATCESTSATPPRKPKRRTTLLWPERSEPKGEKLVRPLHSAENRFLQILISRFSLARQKRGSVLHVQFDYKTPAIWSREAKYYIEENLPGFDKKSNEIQCKLDAFLLEQEGEKVEFSDPDFVFRYVSGGTLPIIDLGGTEYVCLFYRDIKPIGWNIANGGSDSLDELRNPELVIDRELREELIIVDPEKKEYYAFRGGSKFLDRPEFVLARAFWDKRFRELKLPRFEELDEEEAQVETIGGPDSLSLQYGNEAPENITGVYLNINARDFGIEVDRVARIKLGKSALLCDGEINDVDVVDRPIGLFALDDFLRRVQSRFGDKENERFQPSLFFYNGIRYDGAELGKIIKDEFIPCLQRKRRRNAKEVEIFCDVRRAKDKNELDLCPVTLRIAERFRRDSSRQEVDHET